MAISRPPPCDVGHNLILHYYCSGDPPLDLAFVNCCEAYMQGLHQKTQQTEHRTYQFAHIRLPLQAGQSRQHCACQPAALQGCKRL